MTTMLTRQRTVKRQRCPRFSPAIPDLLPVLDLPVEILQKIVDGLKSDPEDVQRFRAVCKSWRAAVPPPLLGLHPSLPVATKGMKDMVYCDAVYLLRDPAGVGRSWLATVAQLNPEQKRKLCLLHHVDGRLIKCLPKDFPRTLNLNALQLNMTISCASEDKDPNPGEFHLLSIKRWIFWQKSGAPTTTGVFLYKSGILMCYPSNGAGARRIINYGGEARFTDVIVWKDWLIAVDGFGRLYGVDFETMRVTTLFAADHMFTSECHNEAKQLVIDENGKLYMVTRSENQGAKVTIFVFMFNEERHVWEVVTSLGDRVLFVKPQSCFFASAKDLSRRCQGDCIVLIREHRKSKSPSILVFKCSKEGNILEESLAAIGLRNIFWPPPRWIWKHGPPRWIWHYGTIGNGSIDD